MMSTDGADVELYAITQELLSNAFRLGRYTVSILAHPYVFLSFFLNRQIIRSAVHGEDAHLKGICSLLLKSPSNQLEQGLLTIIEILVEECPNYEYVLHCLKSFGAT